MAELAIGIDLGTSFSCVGIFQNERVEIIANDQGNRTTPSVVSFTESETLVGESAKNQAMYNYTNTIYDTKRLIGANFNDPEVLENIKFWPFTILNIENKPKYEVVRKGQKVQLSPEEISSIILTKMKNIAESYLGDTIKNAVITVPAYFNNIQRQETINAGISAELNVLAVINEPTAAAIAYGFDKKINRSINILVFDLGGGTFDVSILSVYNGVFEVKATIGDNFLGGKNFTDILINYFIEEFEKKHNINIRLNNRAIGKIKHECEIAKHILSSSLFTIIRVENIINGIDFELLIKREKFESMCDDLFRKPLSLIKTALGIANFTKNDIDEIILIGGSTRIPKIQLILRTFMEGKQLNKSINPDEAVAYGASLHAAMLIGNTNKIIKNIVINEVIPLSIGLATKGNYMSVIIPSNTKIPVKKTLRTYADFSLTDDAASGMTIYEGERKLATANIELCNINVPVGYSPREKVAMDTTVDINANGVVNIYIYENLNNKTYNFTISKSIIKDKDKNKIDNMKNDAIKYAEKDIEEVDSIRKKQKVKIFCKLIVNIPEEIIENDSDKIKLKTLCEKIIKKIEKNENKKTVTIIKINKYIKQLTIAYNNAKKKTNGFDLYISDINLYAQEYLK